MKGIKGKIFWKIMVYCKMNSKQFKRTKNRVVAVPCSHKHLKLISAHGRSLSDLFRVVLSSLNRIR